MAAPVLASVVTGAYSTGSASVAAPSGSGGLLVAFVQAYENPTGVITNSAGGFVLVANVVTAGATFGQRTRVQMWVRVGASGGSEGTFTWTGTGDMSATCVRLTHPDGRPTIGPVQPGHGETSTLVVPTITTVLPDTLVLNSSANWFTDLTNTPSGWAGEASWDFGGARLFSRTQATPGSVGGQTAAYNTGTGTPWATITVGIEPPFTVNERLHWPISEQVPIEPWDFLDTGLPAPADAAPPVTPTDLTVTPFGAALRAEWESVSGEFVLQRETWLCEGDPS